MADSNEEKENPGGEEQARSRLAELEELAAEREQEVSRAKSRIGELEQLIARREEEVATLQQSSLESEQKLAEAGSALSRAVASYRARVIEANPEMPDDLIAGETIEAIDSSLGDARSLISRVRQGLEAEIKMLRIPAGAPQRAPLDLSALSPREKIQHGIGGI